MHRSLKFASVLLLVLGFACPLSAHGQTDMKVGPRVGVPVGDVSDLGGTLHLGANARGHLASLPDPVVLSPSFDFYLADDFAGADLSVFAVDLNGLYEFRLEGSPVLPYAGGGLGFTRISVDFGGSGAFADPSSTEVGLNLVGGARFPLGSVEPFAELNAAVGAERIGFTGGVLFSL